MRKGVRGIALKGQIPPHKCLSVSKCRFPTLTLPRWEDDKKQQKAYEADWTEAGMEEREEPATPNRERDREEHITHLEGECTTPTQTIMMHHWKIQVFIFVILMLSN